MNAERRKKLKAIAARIGVLQEDCVKATFDKDEGNDKIESIIADVESLKDDEQSAFDNLSEGLQASRESDHDDIIEKFDEALSPLGDVDFNSEDENDDINDYLTDAKDKVLELSGN